MSLGELGYLRSTCCNHYRTNQEVRTLLPITIHVFSHPTVPMLLGLTILLVLLAWTLGNTIARSTKSLTLDAHSDRSLHNSFVLRIARRLHSKRLSQLSCALELLRHTQLQTAIATPSPQSDVVAAAIAKTSPFSESSASLIGRTLVGIGRYLGLAARDSFKSTRRSLLRTRGEVG
jgi:hypothetical protein